MFSLSPHVPYFYFQLSKNISKCAKNESRAHRRDTPRESMRDDSIVMRSHFPSSWWILRVMNACSLWFKDLQRKIGVHSFANITRVGKLRFITDKVFFFSQNLGPIWVPSSIMSSNNTKHKKKIVPKRQINQIFGRLI